MPLLAADATALLGRAHAQDRLAHAYFISGAPGSGKRDVARELCALLHGASADPFANGDVHLVQPESRSRRIVIEQIRDLERELHLRSMFGARKIGVLIDADRLQLQAANAFLKTLEEPPNNSLLLLLSALPEQLPDTILSRCIEVQLKATAAREITPLQRSLLGALQNHARVEKPTLPQIFLLVRAFMDLLAEAKEAIATEDAATFKKEEQHYRNTSDSRGWLDDREEYFKALTEAKYRQTRLDLLEILDGWWADVLRHQHGAPALDLAEAAPDTAALAARLTPANCLRRTTAIETLREHLGNPGVQEQLAIECAFITAFAA